MVLFFVHTKENILSFNIRPTMYALLIYSTEKGGAKFKISYNLLA